MDASNSHADWARMSLNVLKLKCNRYNISASGTKKVLVDRLVAYFDRRAEQNGENGDPDGGDDLPPPDNGDGDDYPTDPYDDEGGGF